MIRTLISSRRYFLKFDDATVRHTLYARDSKEKYGFNSGKIINRIMRQKDITARQQSGQQNSLSRKRYKHAGFLFIFIPNTLVKFFLDLSFASDVQIKYGIMLDNDRKWRLKPLHCGCVLAFRIKIPSNKVN